MTKEQFIEHLCNYFNINKNFSKNLVEAGCRNISDVYKYLDIRRQNERIKRRSIL